MGAPLLTTPWQCHCSPHPPPRAVRLGSGLLSTLTKGADLHTKEETPSPSSWLPEATVPPLGQLLPPPGQPPRKASPSRRFRTLNEQVEALIS